MNAIKLACKAGFWPAPGSEWEQVWAPRLHTLMYWVIADGFLQGGEGRGVAGGTEGGGLEGCFHIINDC